MVLKGILSSIFNVDLKILHMTPNRTPIEVCANNYIDKVLKIPRPKVRIQTEVKETHETQRGNEVNMVVRLNLDPRNCAPVDRDVLNTFQISKELKDNIIFFKPDFLPPGLFTRYLTDITQEIVKRSVEEEFRDKLPDLYWCEAIHKFCRALIPEWYVEGTKLMEISNPNKYDDLGIPLSSIYYALLAQTNSCFTHCWLKRVVFSLPDGLSLNYALLAHTFSLNYAFLAQTFF